MAARPDLPTGLDAVVATALAKKKEERQASCGELIAALEAALEGARRRRSKLSHRDDRKLLVAAQEAGTRALVRASLRGRGLQVLEASDPPRPS